MGTLIIKDTEKQLSKVIEFCQDNNIALSMINQEPKDLEHSGNEPIYIDFTDIKDSKRVNPLFNNGEKSKPVYQLLVEKYGEVKAEEIYSVALCSQVGKNDNQ